MSKHTALPLKLTHFFAKLQGMNGDHAKDQKKLAELLKEIKQFFLHQSLGEENLFDMDVDQMVQTWTDAN
jgi:hypothetical protein